MWLPRKSLANFTDEQVHCRVVEILAASLLHDERKSVGTLTVAEPAYDRHQPAPELRIVRGQIALRF
jgi:hypothetical protein